MDKLSEYLPLLIILISLVFTVAGKKKKPGNITQETTLPGKTAGEPVVERPLPRTPSGSYQKFTEEKPKKQAFQKQEIKPGKEIISFSSTPVIFESEEENSSFSFEEEEVRKAIIYAEIINKKEW